MDAEKLREYLTFYQDLGFTSLYRRSAPPGTEETPAVSSGVKPVPPVPDTPSALIALPSLAPEGDTLEQIRQMFRQEGKEYSIVVLRGDNMVQTKLLTRRQI